jgi:hypothetical protein
MNTIMSVSTMAGSITKLYSVREARCEMRAEHVPERGCADRLVAPDRQLATELGESGGTVDDGCHAAVPKLNKWIL